MLRNGFEREWRPLGKSDVIATKIDKCLVLIGEILSDDQRAIAFSRKVQYVLVPILLLRKNRRSNIIHTHNFRVSQGSTKVLTIK